jgi:hypothetical protein
MRRIFAIALVAMVVASCTGGIVIDGEAIDGRVAVHPQLPEAAKQHTGTGAIALARYYFETLGWALTTGDAQPADSVADPDCYACPLVVGVFSRAHGEVGSGLVRLVADRVVLLRHQVFIGAQFGVAVTYHLAADPAVLPSSSDLTSGSYDVSVWLDWRGGGWLIVSLGLA